MGSSILEHTPWGKKKRKKLLLPCKHLMTGEEKKSGVLVAKFNH
jgi:hypothetical protein